MQLIGFTLLWAIIIATSLRIIVSGCKLLKGTIRVEEENRITRILLGVGMVVAGTYFASRYTCHLIGEYTTYYSYL